MSMDDRRLDREDAPVRKSSGTSCLLWTLLLGVGSVVVGGVLCCGGVAYFGLNLMATELEVEIRDNAQIREHLGDLQSVRLNFMKSIIDDDDDVWVYNLTGSKGQGELTVKQTTGDDGDEVFHKATLRLSDGQTVEIDMQPLIIETHTLDSVEAAVEKPEPAEPSPVQPNPVPANPATPTDATPVTPPEPSKPE